ncbi:aminopeptidase N [Paeniglutamicibacter psychrophenolicus]|uniref:aminopeptidase N n=1 Tax=Paeniglutamicibacter psychrophenolicus TaxID=257454 RepID=UPI0027838E9F|nr:aminopeptidase N [Paeniglutamicibacter psychrophenolicus]MDQ0093506.1 aminopeptidase N [Paeniglutamicibacter psychrophenolicus]
MTRTPGPNENLSRDEAAWRAQTLKVLSYRVELDLSAAQDPAVSGYRSRTTLVLEAHGTSGTFLDFIHESIESITLNGAPVDPGQAVAGSRIYLENLIQGVDSPNTLIVDGHARYSRSGEGLHRYVDPADGQTYCYTQFEPADARRVYANFEQPDLKAPFTFVVCAPEGWHVGSNQAPARVQDHGDGTATTHFAPTLPISTYITTVLAGPYFVATDSYSRTLADGTELVIPLNATCRASLAEHFDPENILALTKTGLDYFHELFDYPYPWGKYDSAFVPEYNLGAMENPGLVTFTENYLFTSRATEAQHEQRSNTLMHEMVHMWFGDLVTMSWWDDLWLKESFADYIGTLANAEATEFTTAWTTFANRRKGWAYVADQLPSTHPIVADITDLEAAKQNFDGITYAKGASVLKQLAAYVGAEAFRDAARTYFRAHEYANTTLTDFLSALQAASGRDMGAWADAWLKTAGVPRLGLDLQLADGKITAATLTQSGSDPITGIPITHPHVLNVGLFKIIDGALARTATHRVELAGSGVDLPFLAGAERPDLILPNDGDDTYAMVDFDPVSLATLLGHLGTLADPLARATCWAALWNMVRDAKLPAPEFLAAVRAHAESVTEVSVFAQLLTQATTAITHYLPPALRDAERRALAEAITAWLDRAAPGSDAQVAAARALAVLARGSVAGDIVDSLLAGEERFAGLELDEELRWALWAAKAAGGTLDEASLARLEADALAHPSAVATAGRLLSLAARPQPAVKQAAFHAVLTGVDADGSALSNEAVSATAAGFLLGPHELLDGHYEEYWPALEGIWESMSIGMATRVISGLFPAAQDLAGDGVHPVMARLDAWLEQTPDAPRALRRILLEQRDSLARSLAAQALSAG